MKLERFDNKTIDECIWSGMHESGLKVFVMPKRGYSKSYAVIATKYGSINTEFIVPGNSAPTKVPDGVAHFLEHKLFEEEDHIPVFEKFGKYGASANAFTSHIMTAYLFSCTEHFYENLEILLKYVQAPYFTDENVEKEKGIIGQEIKMYQDDPNWQLYLNALKGLYQKHPVRLDIAGSIESISNINKELLYDCYRTFYHPSNMMLFAIGDVEPDRVAEMVEELIKEKEPKAEIRQIFPDEPEEISAPLIEAKLDVAMPQFIIGFKDNSKDEDLLKKDITCSILTEMITGKSSPLYKSMYESGLINGSYWADYTCEASFSYAMAGGESKDPQAVKEAFLQEAIRLKKEGLDKESFERCKKLVYGRFLRRLNHIESFGNSYVSSMMKNIDLMDYPQTLQSISFEDVNNKLFELYRPEAAVLSVVYPL